MTKIVILGAGIVGAAIAYELSHIPEFQITLLDTGSPGSGATSAALGVLMGIISRKTKGRAWQLRQRSMQRYPELLAELAAAGQRVPYNSHGILNLTDETTEIAKNQLLVQKRQAQGWSLECWDSATIATRCPQVNADLVLGGLYSPQDFQVQPIPFAQALVTVAAHHGVTTRFEVAAPTLTLGDRHCLSVTAGTETVDCDWLIVAAGLGTLEITKPLWAEFQLQPVLGQAVHVKVQDSQPSDFLPVVSYEDVHVVPLGNGEYWVGATVEFPDEAGRIQADDTLMTDVWQRAIAFYPELENAAIVRHWSGKRPRPEGQSAPVIQPLKGFDNILLATGHYRNGVLLAPATALTIRDWLLAPESIPR